MDCGRTQADHNYHTKQSTTHYKLFNIWLPKNNAYL
jgi:hypothetical protein